MRIFFTLFLAMFVASCSEPSKSPTYSGSGASKTVVTLATFRAQEHALWQAVNSQNLIDGVHVNVNLVSLSEYDSILRTSLRNGNIDIFSAKSGAAWYDMFINNGMLVSMDQLGITLDNMNGRAGVVASNGIEYAVPYGIQLQSMIYNKTQLNALGFTNAPQTVAEFDQLMAAAKVAGKVSLAIDGQDGWYLNQVANEPVMAGWVSDATQQGLINGTACFTDSEIVSAFERVIALKPVMSANPLTVDYGGMRTPVITGEAVSMIDGAWTTRVWFLNTTSDLYEVNPDFEPLFGPFPGPNNKVVAHTDGGYAVSAYSPRQSYAAQVLEFTTTAKFAELLVEHTNEVPAYAKPFNIPQDTHPILQRIIEQMPNAAKFEPFFAPSLNAKQPTYGSLSAQAWQGMLGGSLTAQQAAELIQEGLNSWGYIGAANCAL